MCWIQHEGSQSGRKTRSRTHFHAIIYGHTVLLVCLTRPVHEWTERLQLLSCPHASVSERPLGSITHFMLSGVSDTLQRWQYDWRGENQPSETFMCDISERQKMIFFLFSSSEPWKHVVLCDAVNTCDLSDPSFERQSYVTVCHEFGPIRCGYWFYSTSLKACWCGGQWKVQPPSEKLPCS